MKRTTKCNFRNGVYNAKILSLSLFPKLIATHWILKDFNDYLSLRKKLGNYFVTSNYLVIILLINANMSWQFDGSIANMQCNFYKSMRQSLDKYNYNLPL